MLNNKNQIDLLNKIIEKKYNNKVINSLKNPEKRDLLVRTKKSLQRILSIYKNVSIKRNP